MKNSTCAAFLFAMCAWGTSSANAQTCYKNAAQLGAQEAEAFCDVFEGMYRYDVIQHPTHVYLRLCTDQQFKSCIDGMVQHAREYFPLCTWMIHNGWVNTNGENTATAWAEWQRASCKVVTH